MFSEPIHSPLQKLDLNLFKENGVEVWMKRDDLIHPNISGNKWRKLKYNLLKAQSQGKKLIVTFGGAHSNHIAATAALGNLIGIQTKGIIRGEELSADNATLSLAEKMGMELEFISRDIYRERNDEWFKKEILEQHDDAYLIPEGGANFLGVQGCMEILQEIDIDFNYVFTPSGTGTTAAGLALGLKDLQAVYAVAVLKGDFLKREIERLIFSSVFENDFTTELTQKVNVLNDYHFGGYAKLNESLLDFMRTFYSATKVKLDPIYTGKMMFALSDLIKKNRFPEGSRIVALHTGGLQGITGMEEKLGQKIY